MLVRLCWDSVRFLPTFLEDAAEMLLRFYRDSVRILLGFWVTSAAIWQFQGHLDPNSIREAHFPLYFTIVGECDLQVCWETTLQQIAKHIVFLLLPSEEDMFYEVF